MLMAGFMRRLLANLAQVGFQLQAGNATLVGCAVESEKRRPVLLDKLL
jgi:hypothetical protein